MHIIFVISLLTKIVNFNKITPIMKKRSLNFFISMTVFSFFVIAGCTDNSKSVIPEQSQEEQSTADIAPIVLTDIKPKKKIKRKYIRGIHLSALVSGSEKHRRIAADLFDNTELNTAVVDITRIRRESLY